MSFLKRTNLCLRLSCMIGFLLSCYALFVELKVEESKDYEAYCDISEHISCTKAFSSKYGKGFGIMAPIFGENSQLNQPNSVTGIIFYLLLFLMSFSNQKSVVKIQMVLCIISNLISVYLGWILYYILYDLCVICVGTYVINAGILILTISKLNFIKRESNTKKNLKEKSS